MRSYRNISQADMDYFVHFLKFVAGFAVILAFALVMLRIVGTT